MTGWAWRARGPRRVSWLLVPGLLAIFPILSIHAQGPGGGGAPGGARGGPTGGVGANTIPVQDWIVFGKVTTLRGEPVGDAKVRVEVLGGRDLARTVETNLQGEFRTEYTLNATMYTQLKVRVAVDKPGYAPSREVVDFAKKGETWSLDFVLREKAEDPEQLRLAELVNRLGPRLRSDAEKNPAIAEAKEEVQRGTEELFVKHRPAEAVPLLAKVVESGPECIECRMLLSLALLEAGSWGGAIRQLDETARRNEAAPATARRPEVWIVLGVLESWRGDNSRAGDFFSRALELEPENTLALHEFGRVLTFQRNWEKAEQILEKALTYGAGPDARLLRVRALLEAGDSIEAETEMARYADGRDIKDLPLAARRIHSQLRTSVSLRSYGKVKSVVTQPVDELVQAMPELAGLQPPSDPEELREILRKTGKSVEAMFRNLPNTVSKESIRQERQGKDGKVKNTLDQSFRYLLLVRPEDWGLDVEEYRTDARGDRRTLGGLNDGLMLTSGFASAPLLFHPDYQAGATFRYLGRQLLNGVPTCVVAFAQKPETAKMVERFNTDDASVLVLIQGVAWIESDHFRVTRMRSDLLKPSPKLRLHRQTTDIRFEQVPFKESAVSLWLPQDVAVTVDWRGATFRNTHRYSDFMLFKVEAKEQRKGLPAEATEGKK